MKLPTIFTDESLFRQTFEDGLGKLLVHGNVGEFILVCANASNEENLRQHLEAGINHSFEQYEKQFAEHPEKIIDSSGEDDISVYFHIEALGIENLEQSTSRRDDVWELQFNQMRSFRPKRNSVKLVETIHNDFDPDGFHFNKPFLRDETIWAGDLLGRKVDLLYNKFPFAELHSVLVVEREACKPQVLLKECHAYLWSVAEALDNTLPGVGFGYNATGAFASINHLHYQMFVRKELLTVEFNCWQHNGGKREYPALCMVFENAADSWDAIEQLHADDITYNLLYRPGKIYIFPRKFQGTFQHAGWTTGFTWIEMAGEILVPKPRDYEEVTADDIVAEFEKVRL